MVPALAPVTRRALVTPCEVTFTTGGCAKILRVAPRTISKWFDSGRLKGFRLPGSRDRRIYLSDLVAFMRVHGMRVPAELERPSASLVFAVHDLTPPQGVLVAATATEFGALVATERLVAVVIGDDHGVAEALSAAKHCRSVHPGCRIIFALSPDADPERLLVAGFGDCPVAARPLAAEYVPRMLAAG